MTTDAHKVRAAAYFVAAAAPGSEAAVSRELAVLLSPGRLDGPASSAAHRARAMQRATIYDVGGLAVVACLDGESSGRLVSSSSRLAYPVDWTSGQLLGEGVDVSLTSPRFEAGMEPVRTAVLQALRAHVAARYAPGAGSDSSSGSPDGLSRGVEVFTKDGSLCIVAAATMKNEEGECAGAGTARLLVTFGPGGATGARTLAVSGVLSVDSHSHATGTVVVRASKEVPPTSGEIVPGDCAGAARVVVRIVREVEEAWAASLARGADDVSTHVLGGLRRALPVSGVRMDWRGLVGGHEVLAALRQASGAEADTGAL